MNPSVFISYSWGNPKHQNWVREFAARLRSDGVEAVLDQWELEPGDQLTHFMERAIADNQYVLIICTPTYKRKSEAREGGVGYEDNIMTAEVMTTNDHRKFIPILRTGSLKESVPSWLSGKIYIDLSGSPYLESSYDELLDTILGRRAKAPEVKKPKARKKLPKKKAVHNENNSISEFEDVKIVEIIADEVTVPTNDETRGTAMPKALEVKKAIEDNELGKLPELELRLFDLDSGEGEKSSITVVSQPFSSKLSEGRINNTFRGLVCTSPLFWGVRKNKNYASEVTEYTASSALLSPLSFRLKNASKVLGKNVCFKGTIAKENSLSIEPSLPVKSCRFIQDNPVNDDIDNGSYIIEKEGEWEINAELGDIRPGESFVTDPLIYVGSAISKTITIEGYLYGNNIPDPVLCELEVVIEAEEPRSMTMRDVKEYFGRV